MSLRNVFKRTEQPTKPANSESVSHEWVEDQVAPIYLSHSKPSPSSAGGPLATSTTKNTGLGAAGTNPITSYPSAGNITNSRTTIPPNSGNYSSPFWISSPIPVQPQSPLEVVVTDEVAWVNELIATQMFDTVQYTLKLEVTDWSNPDKWIIRITMGKKKAHITVGKYMKLASSLRERYKALNSLVKKHLLETEAAELGA